MAEHVHTVGPGGGYDYLTLQAWEDDADGCDGGTNAAQWAECYSGGNLGRLTIAGFAKAPGANEYPRVYVPLAQRHDGTSSAVGAYCQNDAAGNAIQVQVSYTQIEGLRILNSGTTLNGSRCVAVWATTSVVTDVVVDSCVCVLSAATDSPALEIYAQDRQGGATFQNNIVYGSGYSCNGISGNAYASSGNAPVAMTCANNTILRTGIYGIKYNESSAGGYTATLTVTSTNNIALTSTTADYYKAITNGSLTQTYCMSSDATATTWGGSGNIASVTAANVVTSTTSDAHLKSILSPAVDAGTDPSFTNDATHDTGYRPKRDGYDMGALELDEDALDTHVQIVARDVAYDSAKIFTEANIATLCGLIHDALDAVSNLAFTHTELQSKRDDNTPGS